MVLHNKECGDGDEIPTLDISPTNLSMFAISQHCSTSDPRYSLDTALTNFWNGMVVSANSGRISQSHGVTVDEPQSMPFHFFFINYVGLCELKLKVVKEVAELMWLSGVELQSSMVSMGGHQGYYRLKHCGGWVDKIQINSQVS